MREKRLILKTTKGKYEKGNEIYARRGPLTYDIRIGDFGEKLYRCGARFKYKEPVYITVGGYFSCLFVSYSEILWSYELGLALWTGAALIFTAAWPWKKIYQS